MSIVARRYTASILLIVFCIYNIPKEVYHAFTHHEDSIHNQPKNLHKGLNITNEHHHCELLKLVQEFNGSLPLIHYCASAPKQLFYTIASILFNEKTPDCYVESGKLLRGPPSMI